MVPPYVVPGAGDVDQRSVPQPAGGGDVLPLLDHVAVSRDPSLRLFDKILFAIKAGPRILPKVKERLGA